MDPKSTTPLFYSTPDLTDLGKDATIAPFSSLASVYEKQIKRVSLAQEGIFCTRVFGINEIQKGSF